MEQTASELLLLATNLSQVKSKGRIIELFVEGIKVIFSKYHFEWFDTINDENLKIIPVCTRSKTYGYLVFERNFELYYEQFSLFQNAIQILAILLERIEQDELLDNQKKHLQLLVEKQTNHLIEKQDALNEMNEEFATINEELIETNRVLLKTNEKLQIEIEEHKKTEASLLKSQEESNRFKYALDQIPAYVYIKDVDLKYLYANKICLELFGCTEKEIVGKTDGCFFPPETSHKLNEIDRKVISTGKISKEEITVIDTNGDSTIYIEVKSPLFENIENGDVIGLCGISTNITNLRKLEESMVENEIHFKTLADTGQALIWTSGLDKKCNYFNQTWLNFTGRTLEQELGDGWAEGLHPDDFDFCVSTYVNAFERQEKFSMDYRIRHNSGEYRWIQDDGSPRYNSKGEFLGYIGHCLDITERKNIQKSLIESEIKFRSIVNSSPSGIYFYTLSEDGDLIFSGANPSADRIIGVDHDKFLGKTIIQAFPKLAKSEVPEQYIKIARGEIDNISFEVEYVGNGISGYYQVAAYRSLPGMVVVEFNDISDKRRAEKKLIDSQRLLNESQRISGIGSYTLDIVNGYWVGSEYLDEMFGIKPTDDHSINGWLELVHPDDKAMMQNHFEIDVVANKGCFNKEYRIVTKNTGNTKWVHGYGELEFNSNSQPIKMIGTIQDITYRVYAEDKLRILTRAIDQSPDSIVITNTKAEIEYINPVIEKLSGYSKEELIGKNPRIFSSGNTPREIYKDLWDKITSGDIWQGELQNRKKNGEIYWESASISPVFNNEGKITHYLAIREDITEQKKITKELIEAKEHAEESDRLKTSFLANMSHEIRTPMNSIMGFASLLPEEESKELMAQYANIIVQNAEQLVSIIDGIVMYSKLQTKLFAFRASNFEVSKILYDVKLSFNLPEYNTGVILKTEINVPENYCISTDYDKTRQVITNLVSNAFKFTAKGEIKIGFKLDGEKKIFYVSDTGIGIPEKEKQHIFERFYRGTNVDQSKIRGTGLGLSIVQELVGILGGEIWVESTVGKGSTFWFYVG